jgi:DNA-binding GntR family transcriptional regulator
MNRRSGTALKLIRPVSKRDQVVAAFKDAILRGEIQPGDAIVESRVAQQLGAGVPLVREALIELEHRGYVQKAPYKGTTVTRLDRRQVEQIFRLRIELETLAIEWAKENAQPADLDYLRSLTAKMKRAAETLDLDEFYDNDLAFHLKLWEMSGNSYLVECLERVVVPLFAFYVMKNRRDRESYLASAARHEKLIEALSKLSKDKLKDLMRASLAHWKAETLDQYAPEETD